MCNIVVMAMGDSQEEEAKFELVSAGPIVV